MMKMKHEDVGRRKETHLMCSFHFQTPPMRRAESVSVVH